ncbi:MAG: PocR ligand-binding domain-containing protein, partial [Deltaproteobacteria bacterium]|nr:PocR ligand-binding domain-containing protein [Deltaproteobacteria bacterium]
MKFKLTDLVDIQKSQELLDSFCDAVGIAAAIIDLEGEVLVGARWQRICTDFHRINEQACAKCIE